MFQLVSDKKIVSTAFLFLFLFLRIGWVCWNGLFSFATKPPAKSSTSKCVKHIFDDLTTFVQHLFAHSSASCWYLGNEKTDFTQSKQVDTTHSSCILIFPSASLIHKQQLSQFMKEPFNCDTLREIETFVFMIWLADSRTRYMTPTLFRCYDEPCEVPWLT